MPPRGKKKARPSTADIPKAADNDNLSVAFHRAGERAGKELVPREYAGTDRYLDVVTWNIRYFHDRDKERVRRITDVLEALNADAFVFQEILDGSMNVVAEDLERRGAGHYSVAYGSTGGQQRIALMHDLDWLRLKDDAAELFGKGTIRSDDGKDAFPRLPFLGIFTCLPRVDTKDVFDFQLLGVHLKSQRGGGGAQRERGAKALADWLTKEAPRVDSDVIVLGDWNAPPSADVWKPIWELEDAGHAHFTKVNDESEISHLMYQRASEYGSRLDLACITQSAIEQVKTAPKVVRWTSLDELLEGSPKGTQIRSYIREISANVSDHMPVVTRFYFKKRRSS